MSKLPITEAELQAYVDGLLPDSRRADVEARLSSSPEAAARVRAYREQNTAIRAAYEHVLSEPLPKRFKRDSHVHRWPRYAAIAAWTLVSASGGWMLHGGLASERLASEGSNRTPATVAAMESLPQRAAVAHVVYSPDVRRPVEIGADDEDQLIAWLSKRLATDIKPPKLSDLGYELIGGRLLPGARGPVAQFMYHDLTGQRVTLYVSTEQVSNSDEALRFVHEGPVNVYYWLDRKFAYAVSAGIDRRDLERIASEVHRQVSA